MIALTSIFLTVSLQQGLPPGLLSAICFTETRHEVSAIHFNDGNSNSYGICQLKLESARLVGFKGTAEELLEPRINITYAGKYLKHQILRYADVRKAVIAYNRGHAGDLVETAYQTKVYAYWRQD